MGQVHLLINPAAGAGRAAKAHQQIIAAIEQQGHQVTELRADGPEHVASAIRQAQAQAQAKASKMERLIIAGGDGLVHHALPALAGSETVVGLVSAGTGNDFARSLGLPTKIDSAVKAALSEPGQIDLVKSSPMGTESGVADDGWVATVATSGFSGQVNAAANELRFPKGKQRYTIATLANLPRLQSSDMEVTVDGVTRNYRAALVAVANTRYFGGGMAICPEARPHDGLVHLTIIEDVTSFTMARVLPTVFSGRHVKHPKVVVGRGTTVAVSGIHPFWADGEQLGSQQSLTFSVCPKTLLVAGTSSLESA